MLIDEINRASDQFELLSFPNCSYEQIKNAEEVLGCVLPQELCKLCQMGNGISFGGVEFFGIIENDHYQNLVTQIIRFSSEQGLPKNFVLIRSNGDGTYAAAIIDKNNSENSQIVLWDRSEDLSIRSSHIISPSILEYVTSLIDEEIEFWANEVWVLKV